MKLAAPHHDAPDDAAQRRAQKVVVCYPPQDLPKYDLAGGRARRATATQVAQIQVPPRDARCIDVPAGHFARIVSTNGPQVGDLNIWNTHAPEERFFSGKTRALYGTHVSTGDIAFSNLPYMRPMAAIVDDSLDWYGYDADGGSVHDVIGTRCDPYTGRLLSGDDYHYCCHSNLTRAFADHFGKSLEQAEPYVHDVMNVFVLTGFTRDTHQYFMKASPVRPGDYIEFEAQMDITLGLSACPGGDCGDEHSSDTAQCHPLVIEVYAPQSLDGFQAAALNPYPRSHGR